MAVSARFSSRGTLTVQGDTLSNPIDVSRNAAGVLLVNGGAVAIAGGTATTANTRLVQVAGGEGDDDLTMDESRGAMPRATLAGGGGNDRVGGASGDDLLTGDAGNDVLQGMAGDDLLLGGEGQDVLTGGDGNDFVNGDGGDDLLVWNPGDDSDVFEGGDGTDTAEINGGNGAEVFTLNANIDRVRIERVDPAPFSIDAGTMEVVSVSLNGGDDRFSAGNGVAALVRLSVDGGAGNDVIQGSEGADRLLGGDGNDVIDGERGADTAFLGAGDDLFQWDPGDGSDVVEGQAGSDTLLFNGSNVSEAISVSANGSRALFFRNVANVSMDLGGMETIRFQAFGGADTVSVDDLGGTGVTLVSVDLAATPGSGTGDGAADAVTARGGAGADSVDIFGAGTSATVLGLAARINVTGSEGSNDALVVAGLDGDDTLTATTLPSGVTRLTLDGGSGNDTLLGSQGADLLLGGADNDFVLGDNGSDMALLGAGDDLFQWNPGDGSDVVEGQDGSDTLQFVGANVAERVDILANGGRVLLQRDVGAVTMDLDDTERIEFIALGGSDAVTVGDLSGTDTTRVIVDLSGPGGLGDGATDALTVNGTNGSDSIVVAGNATGVTVGGLHATVSAVFFDGDDRLTVNGQGGDDVINASALAADSIRLTLNGGLGSDLLVGGAGGEQFNGGDGNDTALMGAGDDTFTWNPGDDNDVVEGQSGADTLLFNGANISESISLFANGGRVLFLRDIANVVMDLNDTEVVHFNALGGADTISISDLAGTDVTQIELDLSGNGGGGDGAADTVFVSATAGDDVVVVTGNGGGVSILGLAARIDLVGFEPANDRIVVNLLGGDDVLEASGLAAGGPRLTGNGDAGNDILIGGDGDDVLNGGSGDDVLIGGPGNDVLDGGPDDDVEIQLVGAAISPLATI